MVVGYGSSSIDDQWIQSKYGNLKVYNVIKMIYNNIANCMRKKKFQLHIQHLKQLDRDACMSCVIGHKQFLTLHFLNNSMSIHKHIWNKINQYIYDDNKKIAHFNQLCSVDDILTVTLKTSSCPYPKNSRATLYARKMNQNIVALTRIYEPTWILPRRCRIECGVIYVMEMKYDESKSQDIRYNLDYAYRYDMSKEFIQQWLVNPLCIMYERIHNTNVASPDGCHKHACRKHAIYIKDAEEYQLDHHECLQSETNYCIAIREYDQVSIMGICQDCAERLFDMKMNRFCRNVY